MLVVYEQLFRLVCTNCCMARLRLCLAMQHYVQTSLVWPDSGCVWPYNTMYKLVLYGQTQVVSGHATLCTNCSLTGPYTAVATDVISL